MSGFFMGISADGLFAAGFTTNNGFKITDGKLEWFNQAFEEGKAVFYQLPGSQGVYASLGGDEAADAVYVDLVVEWVKK
jgi:hypothetical protein